MIRTAKGMLVEYALSLPPLAVEFEFNPETLTRSRTITFDGSALPIADFNTPAESNRIGQAASAAAETISMELLLDATDKLSDSSHPMHSIALVAGIEPEIATLRSMLEPKISGSGPFQIMASLGGANAHAHDRDEHLSVLLFVWGTHILPVFITSMNIEELAHLPQLKPYRAKVTINMQVLESNNPFYQVEQVQRMVMSASNLLNLPLPF
ncbi:MAG: hypothetical protein HOM14_09785 [Gammaproteobacteria bacterium]|nr:hypothetical protein [Gammaproteobacteria bacterium]MBT3723278.1 hypothetical protein [Gammaproteobacteria bacterium]MBT4076461.1 hypothetical protein [Gammaproteobacteria bacterium]MBT4194864.1 hypothetical protein [Gammaproteobacteria bacterium]MBT4448474.1 hypothetical protein [Gammaproteobacteria bacterium]